jgi:hypothetical protein
VAQMEQALKEAAALQETEVQKIPEKLAPLLEQLHGRLVAGTLNEESLRLYQEALLLQMRTQSKLLVEEPAITATVREILVVSPHIDEANFNPREKQLVNKIRSAETGRLNLQSSPPAAELLYLGVSLGSTPVDLPLIAGTYKFRLRKDGYRDEDFEVAIRPSELLAMERGLRRRFVPVPIAVQAPAVSVTVNGKPAGSAQGFDAWMTSLSAPQKAQLESAPPGWGSDRRSSSFLLLPDIPVGDSVTIELQAPCYEPRTLTLTVRDEEVDWNQPLHIRTELGAVKMNRDTGVVEISSSPAGSEVLLDGAKQGKTPLKLEVCVGTHKVQVLHPSGQYVRSVLVERGRSAQVSGELKPAIGFLGVYTAGGTPGSLTPSLADWEPSARHLTARITAFGDAGLGGDEVRAAVKAGTLAVDRLPAAEASPEELSSSVSRISEQVGHADLLILGVRTGDRLVFRLYSKLRPLPDLIEVPNVESAALDFLAQQIEAALRAPARLLTPQLGIDLLETTRGVVVIKDRRPGTEAQTPLAPGALIRSVDQRPMDYSQMQAYLRSRLPGQSVTLEISTGKETAAPAPVPVRFSPAEYPWSAPDGLPNAVMAILNQVLEREPAGQVAGLASLSIARRLMIDHEWKRALAMLARANLESLKSGICPGTVFYYQGRCYEELGARSEALAQYTRAREFPEATIGRVDGIPILELVERRIQALKKPPQ